MSVAVATTVLLSSCGGADMCSCMDGQEKMMKEMDEAGDDEAKLKEIEESYKAQMEECKKLGEKMQEEMKDLSPEEAEKKMKEMVDACK